MIKTHVLSRTGVNFLQNAKNTAYSQPADHWWARF